MKIPLFRHNNMFAVFECLSSLQHSIVDSKNILVTKDMRAMRKFWSIFEKKTLETIIGVLILYQLQISGCVRITQR